MKIKVDDKVKHRDNPRWRGIVTHDLDPTRPVTGRVWVWHTPPHAKHGANFVMQKSLLRKVEP